jgi:hypothetical protein
LSRLAKLGLHEALEVGFELPMRVVVSALDGRLFDGAVHAFESRKRPRVWLYRLRAEVLDGRSTLPEAKPAD